MKDFKRLTRDEWINLLWWDRFYGPRLQRVMKQGELFVSRGKKAAVTRIINEAKHEIGWLESKSYSKA